MTEAILTHLLCFVIFVSPIYFMDDIAAKVVLHFLFKNLHYKVSNFLFRYERNELLE